MAGNNEHMCSFKLFVFDRHIIRYYNNESDFICRAFLNPFASEAVYTRNFFFDRLSDSV